MRITTLITTTAALTCSVLLVGAAGTAVADVPVGPGPTNHTEQLQSPPGTCHYRAAANGETLPDPNCTPGATNPKVTPDTLDTTICKTGYTGPLAPITRAEKQANAASYGYTGPLSGIEYDHLLSGALAISDADWPGQNVGGMPLTIATS